MALIHGLSHILIITIVVVYANGDGCLILLNGDLPRPQPLILKPNTNFSLNSFVEPNSDGVLKLSSSEKVILACPGREIVGFGSENVTASCKENNIFEISNKQFRFSNLRCSQSPIITFVKGGTCANSRTLYSAGYTFNRTSLVLVHNCVDTTELRTYYANATVMHTAVSRDRQEDFAAFNASNLSDNLQMDKLYTRDNQLAVFKELLGSEKQANKYLPAGTKYFLTRCQLAAPEDFTFGSQQNTTFYETNVVPQWKIIQDGNWRRVAESIRNLAAEKKLDFQVYTGTYNITKLKHENGTSVPIYLTKDKSVQKIPASWVIWKMVYHPETSAGVAIIISNNPWEPLKSNMICKNITSKFPWIDWMPDKIDEGEGYCCDINDFRSNIAWIPKFPVTKLLYASGAESSQISVLLSLVTVTLLFGKL